MPNKEINITITIFSLVLTIVLLLYQIIMKKKSKSEAWLSIFMVANLGMLVGDFFQAYYYGVPGSTSYYMQNIFTLVVYFCCSGLLLFSFFSWIYFYLSQRKEINKIYFYIAIVLGVIQMIISITMPITKIAYIDENNIYIKEEPYSR